MAVDDKYLYVMQCKNFFKFGISNNPCVRQKEMQIGNPFEIKIIVVFLYKNEEARYMERAIHNYIKESKIHGEWFKNSKKVKQYVEHLILLKKKGERPNYEMV